MSCWRAPKLRCEVCGGWYGSKVWHSNDRYRTVIWQCNNKYTRRAIPGNGCQTPHITEEDIKARFLTAFNILMNDRQGLIEDCRMAQTILCDTSEIDAELVKVRNELEAVSELSRKAIYENARTAMSQSEWSERNNSYLERHKQVSHRLEELEVRKRERLVKGKTLEGFIRDIQNRELAITEFDEKLWLAVIDKVTVGRDGSMRFRFKNGMEVEA